MTNWNKLEGFEAWSAELTKLLSEAETAAQAQEFPARLAVAKRLNEFIGSSRPNNEQVQRLDDLAARTASALMQQSVDERLAEITLRTGEYLKLVKDVESLTAAAEANADSIRLTRLTETIQATTSAIESVTKLKDVLGTNAADTRVAEAIEAAIAAIEELRTRAGKLL